MTAPVKPYRTEGERFKQFIKQNSPPFRPLLILALLITIFLLMPLLVGYVYYRAFTQDQPPSSTGTAVFTYIFITAAMFGVWYVFVGLCYAAWRIFVSLVIALGKKFENLGWGD